MSWYSNLSRRQRIAGWIAAGVGAVWLLGSGDAPTDQTAIEVVTETVTERITEVVTEQSMTALELRSERARLNRVKSNLNDRKDKLAKLTKTLDRRRDELAGQEAALDDAVAAAAPAAVAELPADDPAPETTYYENCSAASAAGAAPVQRGDPGYAPHLDRDGDGVGCESG